MRFEPGVSVGGTGSRFGLAGFNIRGMDGNRVLTLIDGVRVPDEFSFGPFLSARRDFVDVDSLSRAEIARGPISALWGSDAIGGVVAFTTLQPQQYLADGDLHAGVKVGYSSADEGANGALTFAVGDESVAGLLRHTRRDASEQANTGVVVGFGPMRESPDPQSIVSNNTVAKVSFALWDAHRVTLNVDRFSNVTDTRILSDYGTVVFGTTVDSRDATDERARERLSVDYRYAGEAALADRVHAGVYRQASDTEQYTREGRTTPARQTQQRRRDSFFDQRILGVFAQAEKSATTGGLAHVLSYGFEYSATENKSLRDGGTFASGWDAGARVLSAPHARLSADRRDPDGCLPAGRTLLPRRPVDGHAEHPARPFRRRCKSRRRLPERQSGRGDAGRLRAIRDDWKTRRGLDRHPDGGGLCAVEPGVPGAAV